MSIILKAARCFIYRKIRPVKSLLVLLALALAACSGPPSAATVAAPPASEAPPQPTATALAPANTPTPDPFAFVPPMFAGATATPLSQPPFAPDPGFEVWNPHQSDIYLQFDPSVWVLMVGGDPAPYLYEGFQGLFHRTIDSCILSISGGKRAPMTMTGAFELVDFGDYAGEKQTWRDEALVRKFVIYRLIDPDLNWAFLLSSTGITVTMPCIQDAERVIDTIAVFTP
jgi:hypothetical protein